MITELRITDRENTPIKWWTKVKGLQRRKVFRFEPGLNLIVGPNGSGKSSILKALATLTHCHQGGVPKVTNESIQVFHRRWNKKTEKKVLDGMEIVTDGQPVHFFDPEATPGLMAGGTAFDYDFGMVGIQDMFGPQSSSSGQAVLMRMGRILMAAKDLPAGAVVEEAARVYKDEELWEVAKRGLEGTIEKGQRTVLLDEPDRSLDLLNQVTVWAALHRWMPHIQIIVASHNPLAFGRKRAHYIETVKGYTEECEVALDLFRGHLKEK